MPTWTQSFQQELSDSFENLVIVNGEISSELSSSFFKDQAQMTKGSLNLALATAAAKPLCLHVWANQNQEQNFNMKVSEEVKTDFMVRTRTAGPVKISLITNLDIGARARVQFIHLQNEALTVGSEHKSECTVYLGEFAEAKTLSIQLGSVESHHIIKAALNHAGSRLEMNGIFVGQGNQRMSNKTLIQHEVPHCFSRQAFKGVLNHRSRSQFIGEVHIAKGAVGSDSGQVHKAVLLSPQAFAEAEPRLRIDADDVKASHGATVGRLQADEIFYLQSRGLPRKMAEGLLCEAFVQDVVEQIEFGTLKKYVQKDVGLAVRRALAEGPELNEATHG
jgi:Fe-S cluster assembly scaffold protein SufB